MSVCIYVRAITVLIVWVIGFNDFSLATALCCVHHSLAESVSKLLCIASWWGVCHPDVPRPRMVRESPQPSSLAHARTHVTTYTHTIDVLHLQVAQHTSSCCHFQFIFNFLFDKLSHSSIYRSLTFSFFGIFFLVIFLSSFALASWRVIAARFRLVFARRNHRFAPVIIRNRNSHNYSQG